MNFTHNHYRHYRPIKAYDDHQGVFVSSDPYLGPDHTMAYSEFQQLWAISNGRFIVLYPAAKQGLLDAVLGRGGPYRG